MKLLVQYVENLTVTQIEKKFSDMYIYNAIFEDISKPSAEPILS